MERQIITKKKLQSIAKNYGAIDVTKGDVSELEKRKSKLRVDYVCAGIYGISGALIRDIIGGCYYIITDRTTNLFLLT